MATALPSITILSVQVRYDSHNFHPSEVSEQWTANQTKYVEIVEYVYQQNCNHPSFKNDDVCENKVSDCSF